MYAFPKPMHHEDIILFSHNGLASEQAGWEFKKCFYQHVYNYRGGTNELFATGEILTNDVAGTAERFGKPESSSEDGGDSSSEESSSSVVVPGLSSISENYSDFQIEERLKPWKGPYPQSQVYVDEWSKRKSLQRTGPFDRRYEMQDFSLPDLELEKKRHPEEGPRSHMPYGLQ